MRPSNFLIFASILLGSQITFARSLNNIELYYRCYGKLTQERPDINDPLTQQVINGAVTPINACLQVLDRARFTAQNNSQIGNTNDNVAKKVLKTMHNLHASYFEVKDFGVVDNVRRTYGNRDIYDGSSPALYMTRALFSPNTDYSTVVTLNRHLRPRRSGGNPANGPMTNRPMSDYIFTNGIFAPIGDLLGVEPVQNQTFNWDYNGGGSVNIAATRNGGLMGSNPYLLETVQDTLNFKANVLKMPRKWARAVFNDLLCRELPVIRLSDADPFVVPTAGIEFRQSSACVRCHASMDRMSAVVRDFSYNSITNAGVQGRPETMLISGSHGTSAPDSELWPSSVDNDYANRPTKGKLYYRDYQGNLQNDDINSVASLGATLAQKDDLYICAAKRYYNYFTGVDVNTGDLNDPTDRVIASTQDQRHRQNVINLGRALKTHQRLRDLIEDILELPEYRDSAFGNQ